MKSIKLIFAAIVLSTSMPSMASILLDADDFTMFVNADNNSVTIELTGGETVATADTDAANLACATSERFISLPSTERAQKMHMSMLMLVLAKPTPTLRLRVFVQEGQAGPCTVKWLRAGDSSGA